MKNLYIIIYLFIFLFHPTKSFGQRFFSIDSLSKSMMKQNQKDSILIFITHQGKKDSLWTNYFSVEKQMKLYQKRLIDKGYIFNRLKPDKILKTNKYLKIFYTLELKSLQKLDTLIFVGDKKFPKNLKKNIFRKYSHQDLTKAHAKQIQSIISYYYRPKNMNIQSALFQRKTAYIIQIQADKRNHVDAFLGLNNINGKTELQGNIDLQVFNIFKQAETLNFNWQKNTTTQSIWVAANFPFLMGRNFYIHTENLIINQENKNIDFHLNNSLGYQLSRHKIGIRLDYSKKSIDSLKSSVLYSGIEHEYLFSIQYPEVNKFYPANRILSEISWNLKEMKDIIFYNEIHFIQKLFTRNFLALRNYLQISQNQLNQLKKTYQDMVFGTYTIEKNPIRNIYHSELRWMYTLNNYILYAIGRGEYKKFKNSGTLLIKNNEKSWNIGLGINFRNKNQILTFEVGYRKLFGYNIDNQSIIINFKQKIVF